VRTWWTVPDVTAHPDVDRKLMVLTIPVGFGKTIVLSALGRAPPGSGHSGRAPSL
jgi:hypothetical protein